MFAILRLVSRLVMRMIHAPLLGYCALTLFSMISTGTNGQPQILELYPLTTDGRGKTLEPFPTLYWMCCQELRSRVSALEVGGWGQRLEQRLQASETCVLHCTGALSVHEVGDAADLTDCANEWTGGVPEKLSALRADSAISMHGCALYCQRHAHMSYAERRWSLLSADDNELVNQRGWAKALQDVGVAGMRKDTWDRVKCLHAHYAHYLADGSNVVGAWVHELLQQNAN